MSENVTLTALKKNITERNSTWTMYIYIFRAIWIFYIHSMGKTLSYFGRHIFINILFIGFESLTMKYKSNIIISIVNLKKSATETNSRLNFIPGRNKNVVNSISSRLMPQLRPHCILLQVILTFLHFCIQWWRLCQSTVGPNAVVV